MRNLRGGGSKKEIDIGHLVDHTHIAVDTTGGNCQILLLKSESFSFKHLGKNFFIYIKYKI